MNRGKILARLARIREMEEELSRLRLERAVVERERTLRRWNDAASARAEGRRAFVEGVEKDCPVERVGGLIAAEENRERQAALAPALAEADLEIEQLRVEFLARRTAARQAETLMEEERRQKRAEESRRVQQMLDDWYGRRSRRHTDERASSSR